MHLAVLSLYLNYLFMLLIVSGCLQATIELVSNWIWSIISNNYTYYRLVVSLLPGWLSGGHSNVIHFVAFSPEINTFLYDLGLTDQQADIRLMYHLFTILQIITCKPFTHDLISFVQVCFWIYSYYIWSLSGGFKTLLDLNCMWLPLDGLSLFDFNSCLVFLYCIWYGFKCASILCTFFCGYNTASWFIT